MRSILLAPTSAVLLVAMMAVPTDAASLWTSGCDILHDQAAPTCKAKLSCEGQTEAIAAAKRAFQACATGQKLTETDVSDIINQFTNKRYFRCCIGNGQMLSLGHSLQD